MMEKALSWVAVPHDAHRDSDAKYHNHAASREEPMSPLVMVPDGLLFLLVLKRLVFPVENLGAEGYVHEA